MPPSAECPFYALPALAPSLKEESFWDLERSTKSQKSPKYRTDDCRFIHWLQDVPDQAAILRQYCRYSGEVKSGRNIKQMVNRALELAMSDPKGPSYLMAAREVLEEVSWQWPSLTRYH
jgi:thiamine pyrophosphate-dependent acetolactate synthase large subunit-like protein